MKNQNNNITIKLEGDKDKSLLYYLFGKNLNTENPNYDIDSEEIQDEHLIRLITNKFNNNLVLSANILPISITIKQIDTEGNYIRNTIEINSSRMFFDLSYIPSYCGASLMSELYIDDLNPDIHELMIEIFGEFIKLLDPPHILYLYSLEESTDFDILQNVGFTTLNGWINPITENHMLLLSYGNNTIVPANHINSDDEWCIES